MPSTERPRPRPNLFIVGAPKCGTTAWVEYLRTHPGIFFPEVKEPHFFASDLPRMQWVSDLADYESSFERAGSAPIVGEASVMYLYSTEAARAIRAYDPDARILIFLRAQEDFLPSLHHQFLYRFTESIEDFEQAWRLSGKRPAGTIPALCRHPRLLDYEAIGRFGEQVDRYLAEFPADQVRVIRFADWTSDPRPTYLRILDFLGLEDDGRTDFPKINEAKTHGSRLLGRLILHPPRFAQLAASLVRKLLGRRSLGTARRAAQLVAQPGYRTSVSPELRREIRDHYSADNKALAQRLARLPGVSVSGD